MQARVNSIFISVFPCKADPCLLYMLRHSKPFPFASPAQAARTRRNRSTSRHKFEEICSVGMTNLWTAPTPVSAAGAIFSIDLLLKSFASRLSDPSPCIIATPSCCCRCAAPPGLGRWADFLLHRNRSGPAIGTQMNPEMMVHVSTVLQIRPTAGMRCDLPFPVFFLTPTHLAEKPLQLDFAWQFYI